MHVFVIFGLRKRSTEPTSRNGPANEFQKSAVFVFATGKKNCLRETLKSFCKYHLHLEYTHGYITIITIIISSSQ